MPRSSGRPRVHSLALTHSDMKTPRFDPLGLLRTLADHGVASIPDLIWMKRAAGRPQDLVAVEWLMALEHESRD